jgi:hypothetical protein
MLEIEIPYRPRPQFEGFQRTHFRPAGDLELQTAPAASGIARPNAARIFFEGPGGPYP